MIASAGRFSTVSGFCAVGLVALILVSGRCPAAAGAEQDESRCEQALYDPITVGLDGVDAREAFALVARGAGLELKMETESRDTVTLAAEYVLAVEVLDAMAAQVDLEWSQDGCRIVVHESAGRDAGAVD